MVTLNSYFEELNIPATSVVSKEGMILVLKKVISENLLHRELTDFIKRKHKADALIIVNLGTYDDLEINTFQRS